MTGYYFCGDINLAHWKPEAAMSSNLAVKERSFDKFQREDFEQLAEAARQDLLGFVDRNPHHRSLPARLICVALCQGAAQHHVDNINGVKDFDVWSFFADDGGSPAYPSRRRGTATFQGERFASSTRRIDFMGRTLKVRPGLTPPEAIRAYLRQPQTSTARHLSQKAVVMLGPDEVGTIIWPVHQG